MNQQHPAFPALAENIINELTNTSISLSSPLLKTKVLAYRIENQELLAWTNHELTGYPLLDQVPDYRRTTGDIYADYVKGNLLATDQFVDLKGDPELYEMHMCQGIPTLETYTSSHVGETFEGEQRQVIVDYLCSQNRNLQISRIYKKTPANIVLDILSTVRNRLLDFMLEMERTYGMVSDIKALKAFSPAITHIVHNNIINFGDGGIINTGAKAKIEAGISVEKSG
ncbi:hypothetical protein ABIE26_004479 [Pedobacter africanus]|uniref:Uncharacterized protein n=1 Tax=Pedobacter africanus TaxID=151894 RepID=A0ACC6L3J2_9SPHI|nr:hypothetical protein [Pedobacter africanus]MDR6786051.1 hypothetical protein [Pedobacter africanus]